jgi:CRISPR/Cas system-associated endonuclease Cas1
MITLKKEFVIQINNTYNGKEIFTLGDIQRIEKKYKNLLVSNCGILSESHLEFIRAFYIRKFEILQNLERFQRNGQEVHINEAIQEFNEMSEHHTDQIVWRNNPYTFKYLESTNSKEEIEAMVSTHYYDKTKDWFVMSYGSYAYSMNQEQVLEHIIECLENYEEQILG